MGTRGPSHGVGLGPVSQPLAPAPVGPATSQKREVCRRSRQCLRGTHLAAHPEPSPSIKDDGNKLLWIRLVMPKADKAPSPRLGEIPPGDTQGALRRHLPGGGTGSEAAWLHLGEDPTSEQKFHFRGLAFGLASTCLDHLPKDPARRPPRGGRRAVRAPAGSPSRPCHSACLRSVPDT